MAIFSNFTLKFALSIKQKLVALVVLCIFLLASILLFGAVYYQRINKITIFKENLLAFANTIEQIRVAEKQYLNSHSAAIEKKVKDSISKVSEKLLLYKDSKSGRKWSSIFNEIMADLNTYQDLFQEAIVNYKEKAALFDELEKPLQDANKRIDETVEAINSIQFERQIEGERLTPDEMGLSNTARDTKIFFFQLNYLQQQYLLSGNSKYAAEFEKILKGKVESTLRALDQFGKTIGDPEFMDVAGVIRENTEKFLQISNKTQENFKRHSTNVIKLDSQGDAIIALTNKLLEEASGTVKDILRSAIISTCLFLIIGTAVFLVLAGSVVFSVIRPIDNLQKAIDAISSGDLITEIDSKNNDELGKISQKLNGMRANLQNMIKDIILGVQTLTSSSTELTTISKQMNDGLRQTSKDAQTVSESAHNMNANMIDAADSMKGAANSVKTVAASTDQMNATISKIASNTEKAKNFTGDAVNQTDNIHTRVDELGAAAKKIDMVTETITTISDQTNLLALNATIEAARAGDAGKGFAVVATEIKELAKQTALATDDIRKRIEAMQHSTRMTVSDIEKISGIITEVHKIVSSISTAIEEQAAACNDITQKVNDFSQRITQVDSNVSKSKNLSQSITNDIVGVNSAALDMTQSSNQIDTSAQSLFELSNQLKKMVDRFRVA